MKVAIDDNFIMTHYQKRKSWINRHSREIGVITTNPRMFHLEDLEAFFEKRKLESQAKLHQKSQRCTVSMAEIERDIEEAKYQFRLKDKAV